MARMQVITKEKLLGLEIEMEIFGNNELITGTAMNLLSAMSGESAQPREKGEKKAGKSCAAAGAQDQVESDVVVIYDNAGIPSIMRRFRKVTNRELFGGSEKTHPAFIIDGVEYDEIYIGVYEGGEIGGKIYSLPHMMVKTNVNMDQYAEMCFSKGEGWHMMTAQEWGLVANECLRLETMPHGNTNNGHWHGDPSEEGVAYGDGIRVLTGSGPATWTHNHRPDGVYDLCGNVWEMLPGCTLDNGVLKATQGNDMALRKNWTKEMQNILGKNREPVRIGWREDRSEGISITTERVCDWGSCCWGDVKTDENADVEALRELALFCGEEESRLWVDATEPARCLCRGGDWFSGGGAGVFSANLYHPRSIVRASLGGRVAYFKKR